MDIEKSLRTIQNDKIINCGISLQEVLEMKIIDMTYDHENPGKKYSKEQNNLEYIMRKKQGYIETKSLQSRPITEKNKMDGSTKQVCVSWLAGYPVMFFCNLQNI